MPNDYQVVAAAGASLLGIVSFFPYYRDVLRGSTKPHLFTWIIWTTLTGATALIQLAAGGGVGALVAGVESLSCFGITLFAVSRGERSIMRFDWMCLILAFVAIALWLVVHQPLLAIAFAVIADLLAFLPTFRKSYRKPHEETASQFALSAAHWLVSLFALESRTLVTLLYPVAISLFDLTLFFSLIVRRRQLGTAA